MTRLYALLAAGIAAALFGGLSGWWLRDVSADRAIAALNLEMEQARTESMRIGLAHAKRAQEAADAEHLRSLEIQAARAAAERHGKRLHDELQATRTWARGLDSAVASERAAAIAAIELLTELLDRCSLERREVADYADRAASAGRTCVEAWPKK